MNVISYYPKYRDLDLLLAANRYKTINIYLDLKNIMTMLYTEDFARYIVSESKFKRVVDTSIWSSLLEFLSFHKKYSLKRDIDIEFYIFFETGQSYYHLNTNNEYKKNRKIDDLFGLDTDKREYFFSIIHKNLQLIDRTLSLVPDVNVLHLKHLEADFVPYYLIRNNLVDKENILHVVYSNDHDLYQTLSLGKNIYQFVRSRYKKNRLNSTMISSDKAMTYYLKRNSNISVELLPVIMSIIGDSGDNVKGIKGVGPATVIKIIDEFMTKVGSLKNLYDNVFYDRDIFIDTDTDTKSLKKIIEAEENEKLVSKNLRLVSFELLSMYLDNPVCTEMIDHKRKIRKMLKKEKSCFKVLSGALTKLSIDDDNLQILFEDKENINDIEYLKDE